MAEFPGGMPEETLDIFSHSVPWILQGLFNYKLEFSTPHNPYLK